MLCRIQILTVEGSTDCNKNNATDALVLESHSGSVRAEECAYATQYLNASHPTDPQMYHCAPCPLGASCDGATTWSGVKAKFGWYRLHNPSGETPPSCLASVEQGVSRPSCAFSKCIHPPACLGAPNENLKGKFFEYDEGTGEYIDLALVPTWNETCDESSGYRINCTDEHNKPSRCRLCATCKVGYKRDGAKASCMKCPSQTANRAFLALGLSGCVLSVIYVIYTTIRAELLHGSGSSRSAVKKIILNFISMISLAGGLPVNWPSILENIFEFFYVLASAGGNLVIPDCELTYMRAAEAFYLKQIVYAFIIPLLFVMCTLTWTLIYKLFKRDQTDLTSKSIIASWVHAKNATVMSIVLLVFLIYPLLVNLCLSILKCPYIQGRMYLSADLQWCHTKKVVMQLFKVNLTVRSGNL